MEKEIERDRGRERERETQIGRANQLVLKTIMFFFSSVPLREREREI